MPSTSESHVLASSLNSGDETAIERVVAKAASDGSSLRDFFKELFKYSAKNHRCEWSSDGVALHPLTDLNALKNLAALRLDSPSRSIVKEVTKICLKVDRFEQEFELENPTPIMLNQPLFTQEFIWAVAEADREKAVLEAAKILAVSDNPSVVIEIVMEIATHHMERIGSFAYSVYRSATFSGRDAIGDFLILLLSALTDEPWPLAPVEGNTTSSLTPYLEDVLRRGDDPAFCQFATAARLWSVDSVRQPGFRKGLLVWAQEMFEASAELEHNGSTDGVSAQVSIMTALDEGNISKLSSAVAQARAQNDWSWPTLVAERWIELASGKRSRFLFLDSLQSVSRTAPASLLPLIAERLVEVDRLI
ncbi:MAG: hypothetical protein VX822_01055 [Candidatus Neomarinimicrobiota bacterium]|nr:hypothetical protein [Candidatus Neomarinimicrobiota bacterium]